MEKTCSLRNMAVGQRGRISAVKVSGLVPGVTVSVVGRAPLHDPVALRLSGVTITLRNNEADYISIVQ